MFKPWKIITFLVLALVLSVTLMMFWQGIVFWSKFFMYSLVALSATVLVFMAYRKFTKWRNKESS